MTNARFRLLEPCRPTLARCLAMLVCWCVVASVLFGFASLARAGSGGIVTLPLSGVKSRSRLKIKIDTRWVDGTGYRPV